MHTKHAGGTLHDLLDPSYERRMVLHVMHAGSMNTIIVIIATTIVIRIRIIQAVVFPNLKEVDGLASLAKA